MSWPSGPPRGCTRPQRRVTASTAPPDPARRFSRPDQTVADALTAYWTRFALTLDPNHAGAAPWPRYRPDAPVRLVIDGTMAPSRDFSENCTFWDSVGYDEKGLFERMRVRSPAVTGAR